MLPLRPYQQTLLRQAQYTLDNDPNVRVMLQLPTGGGKTVIAAALLSHRLTGGRKAVWLTHRKELAAQTRRMLADAGVAAVTDVNWTPGADAPSIANGAVILMAQTVTRRTARREAWRQYHAGDLLVIDEAHHAAAGWTRAIRQWPGPVLGMTATPWRLSENEGFDHLFGKLLCGPPVAQLQELGSLCPAQVLMPPPPQRIAGGAVDHTGDYTEAGIAQANRDRPDIMTAGALEFWRKHCGNRQTIAYAVSAPHARNLAAIFNAAGIPAAAILGNTHPRARDAAIANFRDRRIRLLVNVLVATEGFDLPDASCIIIARPTMSLALYLQMIGRGLRPKPDGGNCLILDLAANSITHGLPDDYREWSLQPRGRSGAGPAPVVWCPHCQAVAPAASRNCPVCGYDFGKHCHRCGQWRAWRRWEYEQHCGDAHQPVCDLCHIDAHIQAHLPVTPPLDGLIDNYYNGEDGMIPAGDFEIDDALANRLAALFQELLETERAAVVGADDARRSELRLFIAVREAELKDESALGALFDKHIDALPETERPQGRVQESHALVGWVGNLRTELADWRSELEELERRPVDKPAIFNSARSKTMYLLRRAAQASDLLAEERSDTSGGFNLTLSFGGQTKLYIKAKGIAAECDFYSRRRIVVLSGSQAVKAGTKSLRENEPGYWKIRNDLIAGNVLVDEGQWYRFDRDCEFTSASAVAAVVLSDPSRASLVLKDTNGVSLKDLMPER